MYMVAIKNSIVGIKYVKIKLFSSLGFSITGRA